MSQQDTALQDDVQEHEQTPTEEKMPSDNVDSNDIDSVAVEESPLQDNETKDEIADTPEKRENFFTRQIHTKFSPSLTVLAVVNMLTALILLVYQVGFPSVLPYPEKILGNLVLLACSIALIVLAVKQSKIPPEQATAQKQDKTDASAQNAPVIEENTAPQEV